MASIAKALILIAAVLAAHTAHAAGPKPAPSINPESDDTASPAPDGASLFRTHCAMCHKPAELARGLQSAADQKAAMAEMASFLDRHGRSDADADAAIIDYLAHSRAP